NSGVWWDGNSGDSVTLRASVGTVVQSGSNATGTWSWSYSPTDGPIQSQFVTISADNGHGVVANTNFHVQVNDVNPQVVAGADTALDLGTSLTRNGWFTDPGSD